VCSDCWNFQSSPALCDFRWTENGTRVSLTEAATFYPDAKIEPYLWNLFCDEERTFSFSLLKTCYAEFLRSEVLMHAKFFLLK